MTWRDERDASQSLRSVRHDVVCMHRHCVAPFALTQWEFNLPAEDQFHVFAGNVDGAIAVFPPFLFVEIAVFACSWDDFAMDTGPCAIGRMQYAPTEFPPEGEGGPTHVGW